MSVVIFVWIVIATSPFLGSTPIRILEPHKACVHVGHGAIMIVTPSVFRKRALAGAALLHGYDIEIICMNDSPTNKQTKEQETDQSRSPHGVSLLMLKGFDKTS